MGRWFGMLCGLLLVSACAANVPTGPHIRIENGWVTPVLVGSPGSVTSDIPSAGYFTIVNDGDAPDILLGASSDAAMMIHMHESQVTNDIAQMNVIPQLDIPAHSRVDFKPGALHLMIMGVQYDLNPGMQVTLHLQFAKSGILDVTVPVQQEPVQ